MPELKTKKTTVSIESFINKIPEENRREDVAAIVDLMEKATNAKGIMWGPSIIGFGDRKIKYENGRELDWFVMGFSPRKQNFALYIPDTIRKQQALLKKLGKYKTGKGCLYINKLEEVDAVVLKEIILKGAGN